MKDLMIHDSANKVSQRGGEENATTKTMNLARIERIPLPIR